MENRSLSVVALLSGLLLMPLPALADNGSDAQQMADWAQRLYVPLLDWAKSHVTPHAY